VAIVIVWFGLVMVAQAFQEAPKAHRVAVALGLLPMLASRALELVNLALQKAGSSLFEAAPRFGDELPIYGLIALSRGGLLVSMIGGRSDRVRARSQIPVLRRLAAGWWCAASRKTVASKVLPARR
jgi:hypothetical protein